MKRAWPYALALAVVVTGCYLALAPLLRSLSPAPTTSANRLSQNSNVQTVGKSKTIKFTGSNHGTTGFVSNLATKKKKAKKVAKPPAKTTPKVNTSTSSSNSTGVSNTPSSSSSNSTPKSTPTAPASPTKTTNRKNSAVGGQINQGQGGDGFAGPTGGGNVVGGQTLAPGN